MCNHAEGWSYDNPNSFLNRVVKESGVTTINPKLVEVAMDYVGGTEFENFFNVFYPSLAGIDFVPLGGMQDGGADAFDDPGIFEGTTGRASSFYQATIEKDHRSKIRRTVKRLREFGREPKVLNYFTAQTVRYIDREEEELSEELDVSVKIRDRKWIAAQVNYSPATIEAFNAYVGPAIAFLSEVGGTQTVRGMGDVSVRSMCVFLGQEVERRKGNTELLESVTDGLILWALEGTDPDAKIFLTREEIRDKIEGVLPTAKDFIRGVFDHRLELLSKRGNSSKREVRRYPKDDKYCLPYETRQVVVQENTEDEYLRIQVTDIYVQRVEEAFEPGEDISAALVADISHRALELTFEKEGLELSEFLTNDTDSEQYSSISDQVDEAIKEFQLLGAEAIRVKELTLGVLRQAFYSSEEVERLYYGKLSRTYTLLFTLRNEPQIVEHFRAMSSDFVLFVGADIIVRMLSEMFLAKEDQMTANMLSILKSAGSTLILTQMAVEEIQAHLQLSDTEFQNDYLAIEPHVDREFIRHCDKILIRAYFYAKHDETNTNRPDGWKTFINRICNYENLHETARSRELVKNYLLERFGFEYMDRSDIEDMTDSEELESLTQQILEVKSEKLAINDALHILGVYGMRRKLGEFHRPSPYGFKTWWLTHEKKVLRLTKGLVKEKGSRYIIRPEFILNFIALSPSMAEVRDSFGSIFPTLLGVRLSNRMKEDAFKSVIQSVKDVRDVDESRARAMLSDMTNELKGDGFKEYENNFNNDFK